MGGFVILFGVWFETLLYFRDWIEKIFGGFIVGVKFLLENFWRENKWVYEVHG